MGSPSVWLASQVALVVKNLPANAGDIRDTGWIPDSGRSPGEGQGNPLQYSCLENPKDRGAWQATVHGVTKSWTLKSMRLPLLEFVWWITCGSIAGFYWSFLFWGIRLKKQLLLRIYSYNIREKKSRKYPEFTPLKSYHINSKVSEVEKCTYTQCMARKRLNKTTFHTIQLNIFTEIPVNLSFGN